MRTLKGDYSLGGGWGNHIDLLDPEKFGGVNLNTETVKVYGHQTPIPRKGQTLVGEFEQSFIKFKFVNVKQAGDPRDMFFADIKAIDQEMKIKEQ